MPPFIRDLLLVRRFILEPRAVPDPQCESGINDGAATPYLMIPLMLITSGSPGKDYVLEILLKDTALGIVGGFALGTVARLAFEAAQRRRWIDKESRLVWTIALALFTTGLVSAQLLAC